VVDRVSEIRESIRVSTNEFSAQRAASADIVKLYVKPVFSKMAIIYVDDCR